MTGKIQAKGPTLVSRAEAAAEIGVHPNTLRLWEAERTATGRPVLAKVIVTKGARTYVHYRRAQLLAVAKAKSAARTTGTVPVPAADLWARLEEARRSLAAAIEARARAEVEAAVAKAGAEAAERRAEAAESRLAALLPVAGKGGATGRARGRT